MKRENSTATLLIRIGVMTFRHAVCAEVVISTCSAGRIDDDPGIILTERLDLQQRFVGVFHRLEGSNPHAIDRLSVLHGGMTARRRPCAAWPPWSAALWARRTHRPGQRALSRSEPAFLITWPSGIRLTGRQHGLRNRRGQLATIVVDCSYDRAGHWRQIRRCHLHNGGGRNGRSDFGRRLFRRRARIPSSVQVGPAEKRRSARAQGPVHPEPRRSAACSERSRMRPFT